MFIVNFVKKSLQLELYNFADLFNIPSVTKQAFSKARKKLSPVVFQLLNKKLIQEFYTDNEFKLFKGLRLLAIDGSVLRLPYDKELAKIYGISEPNKSVPLARTSVLFDLLNELTLHAKIGPFLGSERDLAVEHIKELNELNNEPFKDLLMFDRGYPSLFLIFLLYKSNKHFLMRIQQNSLSEFKDIINSDSNDSIISLPAFRKGRNRNEKLRQALPSLDQEETVQIRILKFTLSSGQKEILITSLIDQNGFAAEDIFKLYNLRWNVEECYKLYKNIAEIENFSGKTKIAIEQDFYATIFACNLSSLLMQEAQDELSQNSNDKELKYEYKVNRNILIGVVKNEIIEVFLTNQNISEYCEKLKNRIKQNLVPIRPERFFPRIFKRIRSTIDKRAI